MDAKESEPRSPYGFKMVNESTILDPDPLMATFVTMDDGAIRPVTPNDWARPILQIELSDAVAYEVRRAFYFARNAMPYAHWYYPLLTIGIQQALRVADYATEVAARENGILPDRSFRRRIDQLLLGSVIPKNEGSRWVAMCRLRNNATHPAWQEIWGIGQVVLVLRDIAEAISALKWPIKAESLIAPPGAMSSYPGTEPKDKV